VAEKSETVGVGIMSRRGLAALREGPYAHRTPGWATRVKNSGDDVEEEAHDRRAMGDSILISDQAKIREITKRNTQQQHLV
jgi:hypothetical protein